MPSTVYFTSFRTSTQPITHKLKKMLRRAGLQDLTRPGQFAALKIHFGETGNLAYLRPQYPRAVAEVIREGKGLPFLTDCNTLYVGTRKNALEHLLTAEQNGFSWASTGCQIIIGDGLKGTDDIEVPIVLPADLPASRRHFDTALIGRAVMDADVIVSVNHFKAHEATGIGGAIKNLGMGCGSRAGKMRMHSSGKPVVDRDLCIFCKACARACGSDAIDFPQDLALIDHGRCVGCGRCIGACPVDAIATLDNHSNQILWERMNEYTKAVVHGRPQFHISIVNAVSPFCDCHAENDLPMIPDVGMFCSLDPVAIDQACADACNRMPAIPGSILEEARRDRPDLADLFTAVHPETNWKSGLADAERIGLGSRDYQLVTID